MPRLIALAIMTLAALMVSLIAYSSITPVAASPFEDSSSSALTV